MGSAIAGRGSETRVLRKKCIEIRDVADRKSLRPQMSLAWDFSPYPTLSTYTHSATPHSSHSDLWVQVVGLWVVWWGGGLTCLHGSRGPRSPLRLQVGQRGRWFT